MIPKLKRYTQKISHLENQMNSIIAESLEDNKEFAADLITDQLLHGIKGDGEELTEYRNNEYADFKRSIGSISSPVADLKLHRDYHESIKMEVSDKEGVVSSTDRKDGMLSLKYGEEIKQYTEESKKELRLQIKPDIQIRVNEFIKTK